MKEIKAVMQDVYYKLQICINSGRISKNNLNNQYVSMSHWFYLKSMVM